MTNGTLRYRLRSPAAGVAPGPGSAV